MENNSKYLVIDVCSNGELTLKPYGFPSDGERLGIVTSAIHV